MPKIQAVTATWEARSMVFRGEAPGRGAIVIDGETAEGPGPMDALLLALAGCSGSDVVEILRKKRLDLLGLRIEVTGTRRDEYPRRFTAIDLVYHVSAQGATEQHVRQAIELSLQKYCSVSASLNPDIPVRYELVLRA